MRDFFAAPQGAAVLKHGIIRRYLPPFATKVGLYAPDQRVVLLDAYAGPGAYTDGASRAGRAARRSRRPTR